MTQRRSHQRFPNSKQNTPLTCFLAHKQTKTSRLVPLMTLEKHTNCRSFRAYLCQSIIISPSDVFRVFHNQQMKAICTHTGQSKHLKSDPQVCKSLPDMPRQGVQAQLPETLSAPWIRREQRRRWRTRRGGNSNSQIRQLKRTSGLPFLNAS